MTGPEHYRTAERLLDEAEFAKGGLAVQQHIIAKAAVHATLALAAATAIQPARYAVGRPESRAWIGAAAVPERPEDRR